MPVFLGMVQELEQCFRIGHTETSCVKLEVRTKRQWFSWNQNGLIFYTALNQL